MISVLTSVVGKPAEVSSYVLQFISFIMVSFSFLSYVALICSLVCIPTIGYIL